MSTRT